jgi:hypothetical protein
MEKSHERQMRMAAGMPTGVSRRRKETAVNKSQKLTIGGFCVAIIAGGFAAGYLFVAGSPKIGADDTVAVSEMPPDPPAPAPVASHKYNVTIETTADWSRVILLEGAFVTGEVRKGFNNVELSSEEPPQVRRFVYSPEEVLINQKQFAQARIMVKGVVETSRPVVEVRLGHGDNGVLKISSPVDSFTADQILGDGVNFMMGTLRLE